MKCPRCGGNMISKGNVFSVDGGHSRRRQCNGCGYAVLTHEQIVRPIKRRENGTQKTSR